MEAASISHHFATLLRAVWAQCYHNPEANFLQIPAIQLNTSLENNKDSFNLNKNSITITQLPLWKIL